MSAPRFIMGKSKSSLSSTSRTTTGGTSARAQQPDHLQFGVDDDDANIPEYSSPADVCPVCKTDRFLNPKLRLMVSSCYHKMCESCMDRIFSLGPEPCPVCHTTIRKAHFKPQRFEDLGVQKELAIRKKMARTFNKTESDFISPQAYNAYLEEVESWTFKLISELDVEETESHIRRYLEQNQDSIESNLEREGREKLELRRREEEERRGREMEREEWRRRDEEDERGREEERRAILEGLESSTLPATSLIRTIRTSALKRSSARLSSSTNPSGSSTPSAGLSSLRFSSGLKPAGGEEEEEEEPGLLEWWDDYSYLYEILPRGEEEGRAYDADLGLGTEQERGDEGGFVVEEVWEKAVRCGVAGVWVVPVRDEEEGMEVDS